MARSAQKFGKMLKNFLTIGIICLCLQSAFAQDFNQQCLTAHNDYRKLHGVPNLSVNSDLVKLAQAWAKYLADNDLFEHRPNNKYGENIFGQYGSGSPTCATAVKSWYDEIESYNFNKPGFSSGTGHFTQVVWKNSLRVGCGLAKKGTSTIIVCNYDPPGNYLGQFPANVLKN